MAPAGQTPEFLDAKVISLGAPWLSRRVAELALLGVRTLLCGGFNRAFLPTAERLGVQVVTGVSGDAEKALAAFLSGKIPPGNTRMRRCRRLAAPTR